MATQKKKVYLAGKVGGIKHELVKDIDPDMVEFVCSDGSDHSEHSWGNGSYSYSSPHLKAVVQEAYIDIVRQCQVLIAVLDSPDSFGSIAEIAFASALGIPCALLVFDKEQVYKNDMRDAYWFVSNFPGVKTLLIEQPSDAKWFLEGTLLTESPMELNFFLAIQAADSEVASQLRPQAKFPTGSFTYRVDFLYEREGKRIAVEVDGHEGHKTKEQRTHDAQKDRFLKSQGVEVVRFTGTELYNDMSRCVREFVTMVQGSSQP